MTTENNEKIDYPDECFIDVIGKDNKAHIALSWENKCLCGVDIKEKNPNPSFRIKHFSCYECTY